MTKTFVHTIFADGVWHAVAGSDVPKFQRIRSPTQHEVEELTLAVRRRVLRRLGRLGVLRADLEDVSCDLFREREPVLAGCTTASLLDRVAVGERAGELVMRLRDEVVEVRGNGIRCAVADGFNVHAATTVATRDRGRLERLCKYILRPAICNERMQRLESGEVLLTLRKRWSDGTFAKLFQPQDLISKVIALLPAPGTNLVRFHGQFAPGARWRPVITAVAATKRKQASAPRDEEQRQRRMSWALLLKRSFSVDVLVCPHCGGQCNLLAVIEHKPTVQKILEHDRDQVADQSQRPHPRSSRCHIHDGRNSKRLWSRRHSRRRGARRCLLGLRPRRPMTNHGSKVMLNAGSSLISTLSSRDRSVGIGICGRARPVPIVAR